MMRKNGLLMKRVVCACLFCAFFLVAIPGGAATRIKVLDFNIRKSGELAGYQVKPFADLILEEKPDLVALQEVDYRMSRSGNKDFLTELAANTGMFPLFAKAIETDGGEYGVAVLSKYPVANSKIVPLSAPDGTKERRVALVCDVEFPDGEMVRFVSTHLDNSTDEVRTEMVRDLNSSNVISGNNPVLLCGDFNATPQEDAVAAGMTRWKLVGDVANTFPASRPTSKIDYIFSYPEAAWQVVDAEVPVSYLSDHRPVVAVLELNVQLDK